MILGLIATIAIWALGNLTPVLFDIFLQGEIDHTTAVAFLMGLYGVASGGIISILSEKLGFLNAADFRKGKRAVAEIDGIAADQIKETKGQKELKEMVKARQKELKKLYKNSNKQMDANDTSDLIMKYDLNASTEEIEKKEEN